jgi:hypothetical protein
MRLTLDEPYQLQMVLEGASDAPVMSIRGNVPGGHFAFKPKDEFYPVAELHLGAMRLSWDSEAPSPVGSFAITDGTLTHKPTGLKARKVSGVLTLGNKKVIIDPINAELTGNPFVGAFRYDFISGKLDTSANGTFSGVEKLLTGITSKDLSIAGALSFRFNLIKDKKRYVLDAEADGSQAEFGYQWWFVKPAGVEALGKKIHAEIAPYSAIVLSADTAIAGSNIEVSSRFEYNAPQKKWRLDSAKASDCGRDRQGRRVDVDARQRHGRELGFDRRGKAR